MSSDRKTFILINDRVRSNALAALLAAPDGYVVTVRPATRSVDQNAMFHSICGQLAKSSLKWAGKTRDSDQWKVLLVSAHTVATKGDVEIVPGIENEFVNIRESTARMSVGRMSSLIEYALAFCATNGVELQDAKYSGFLEAAA